MKSLSGKHFVAVTRLLLNSFLVLFLSPGCKSSHPRDSIAQAFASQTRFFEEEISDFRLKLIEGMGIDYRVFAEAPGIKNYERLRISFSNLTIDQFETLKSLYGHNQSHVVFDEKRKNGYEITDFLPPKIQALDGLRFNVERFPRPGYREGILASNCWGTAFEVLRPGDESVTVFSSEGNIANVFQDSRYGEEIPHDQAGLQRMNQEGELFAARLKYMKQRLPDVKIETAKVTNRNNNLTYFEMDSDTRSKWDALGAFDFSRNSNLKPLDLLLVFSGEGAFYYTFSELQDGLSHVSDVTINDVPFLAHAAIYIDSGLFFEKTGIGSMYVYRLTRSRNIMTDYGDRVSKGATYKFYRLNREPLPHPSTLEVRSDGPVEFRDVRLSYTKDGRAVVDQLFSGAQAPDIAMARIAAGRITIRKGEMDNNDDVDVVFPQAFWVAEHEITQLQFFRVMGFNPSYHTSGCAGEMMINSTPICPSLPIDNISWSEASEFVFNLNRLTGMSYQMLSTLRWQYIARTGGIPSKETAWFLHNSGGQPHDVGQRAADRWGAFDIYGNVAEWALDEISLKGTSGVINEMVGPASPSNKRALGADYNSPSFDFASRPMPLNGHMRHIRVGFRVMLNGEGVDGTH